MKISIIRKVDKYIGPTICRLLLFINFFFKMLKKGKKKDINSGKNFLILKYFGMGSILLAAPALIKLKENNENSKIIFLTTKENEGICNILDFIDETICVNISNPFVFIKSYLIALRKIASVKITVIFDLEFLTNFSALTTLVIQIFLRVNNSVGFNSSLKYRNTIYNYNISFDHSSRHISKIFLKFVSPFLNNSHDVNISLHTVQNMLLKSADYSIYRNVISKNINFDRNKVLVVNVNAGILSYDRRWPKENFLELINKILSEKDDVIIALIGGKNDVSYVADLYDKIKYKKEKIFNVSGNTSLPELLGLLANAHLLITNDSGPLHLGYFLGTTTVSFFGPETPYLYGPIGEKHYFFYSDLYCSPCLNIYNSKLSQCKENICLEKIFPQKVYEVLNKKYL